VPPFVGFRSPRRDDAPFIAGPIGVNNRDFQAIHKADGVDPNLAVVEAIIDLFDRRSLKNSLGILKGNSVPCDVAPFFRSSQL
jgi:hypothetical protein